MKPVAIYIVGWLTWAMHGGEIKACGFSTPKTQDANELTLVGDSWL